MSQFIQFMELFKEKNPRLNYEESLKLGKQVYNKLKKQYQTGGVIDKQVLCVNIKHYSTVMNELELYNGAIFNFNFNFLDNSKECLYEALDFLKNKDNNMRILEKSLSTLNMGLCDNSAHIFGPCKLSQIIFLSMGSSSTQAYCFKVTKSSVTATPISLGNGAWYGVQNYKNNLTSMEELYDNVDKYATENKMKYVILQKSGRFGIKTSVPFKTEQNHPLANSVVSLDVLPECLQYTDDDFKQGGSEGPNSKSLDAYYAVKPLIKLIKDEYAKTQKSYRWLSLNGHVKNNFNCNWIDGAADDYFERTTNKSLYMVDFGGGSFTLKIYENYGQKLSSKLLIDGSYKQPGAIKHIDTQIETQWSNLLAGYTISKDIQNYKEGTRIKDIIIDSVYLDNLHTGYYKKNEEIDIHIFQTGLQREWVENECSEFPSLKSVITDRTSNSMW